LPADLPSAGEVVTREYTINLHKRLHGIGFKYRAPRAVKVTLSQSFGSAFNFPPSSGFGMRIPFPVGKTLFLKYDGISWDLPTSKVSRLTLYNCFQKLAGSRY
jgi:hypothetical protein